MENEDKYKNLDRINFWITNCDTKVSFILALQGILVTILATNAPIAIFRTFSYVPAMNALTLGNIFKFAEFLSLLGAIFYFCSAMYFIKEVLVATISYDEILKLLEGTEEANSEEKYQSRIFFMSIATMTLNSFRTIPKGYLLDKDIDTQICINSRICAKKFQNYNKVIEKCTWLFACSMTYIALNTFVQLYFSS